MFVQDLSLRLIFEFPTVGEIARKIAEGERCPGEAQEVARARLRLREIKREKDEAFL
jgi:hypothetical protein